MTLFSDVLKKQNLDKKQKLYDSYMNLSSNLEKSQETFTNKKLAGSKSSLNEIIFFMKETFYSDYAKLKLEKGLWNKKDINKLINSIYTEEEKSPLDHLGFLILLNDALLLNYRKNKIFKKAIFNQDELNKKENSDLLLRMKKLCTKIEKIKEKEKEIKTVNNQKELQEQINSKIKIINELYKKVSFYEKCNDITRNIIFEYKRNLDDLKFQRNKLFSMYLKLYNEKEKIENKTGNYLINEDILEMINKLKTTEERQNRQTYTIKEMLELKQKIQKYNNQLDEKELELTRKIEIIHDLEKCEKKMNLLNLKCSNFLKKAHEVKDFKKGKEEHNYFKNNPILKKYVEKIYGKISENIIMFDKHSNSEKQHQIFKKIFIQIAEKVKEKIKKMKKVLEDIKKIDVFQYEQKFKENQSLEMGDIQTEVEKEQRTEEQDPEDFHF